MNRKKQMPPDGVVREFPFRHGDVCNAKLSITDITLDHERSLITKRAFIAGKSITVNKILGTSKIVRSKESSLINVNQFEKNLNKYVQKTHVNLSVVDNAVYHKMLACVCFKNDQELKACCHLIMSHALALRQLICFRKMKFQIKNSIIKDTIIDNLDPKYLDIYTDNSIANPKTIMSTLNELPSEWYIVQLTTPYEPLKQVYLRKHCKGNDYAMKPMHDLHIMVLPTKNKSVKPICINVSKPQSNSGFDIRVQIESLLNKNKSDLTNSYNNNDLYWKMRKKQDLQMSNAITELEFSWLREWRVLLLADYVEHLDIVKDICDMIDKLIADSSIKTITERTRWLLKKIATGAWLLKPFEIERAVKYILPNETKLVNNIVLSIIAKVKQMELLKNARRKVLILILDESLDHISFESMSLLKHQPVTRFPSLHIVVAIYNRHKDTIKDGYKIIQKSEKLGTFIVNPSSDLPKMEKRMKVFIEYYLTKWEGTYGIKPDLKAFKTALVLYDILMYTGHGSGIQFVSGEEIEKIRVKATVLLFGCSSVRLVPSGGRMPAHGVSNQYLMSSSPCVLGMLWEVTDGDIDKMTVKFLSTWVSNKSWKDINTNKWNEGIVGIFKDINHKVENEPNMLLAVAKSKDICRQYMTSAAIIVRGLPVKVVD